VGLAGKDHRAPEGIGDVSATVSLFRGLLGWGAPWGFVGRFSLRGLKFGALHEFALCCSQPSLCTCRTSQTIALANTRRGTRVHHRRSTPEFPDAVGQGDFICVTHLIDIQLTTILNLLIRLVARMGASHAPGRGSIPRWGTCLLLLLLLFLPCI
jgi:hypothetical protein